MYEIYKKRLLKEQQHLTSSLYLMHLLVDFHQIFTKGVLKINEQLLKWRDVQRKSPRKSLKKTLGGGCIHPPPPLYVRGLN